MLCKSLVLGATPQSEIYQDEYGIINNLVHQYSCRHRQCGHTQMEGK